MAAPFRPHHPTPLLRSWGEHADLVARLAVRNASLAQRLLLAPARAVHVVSACLPELQRQGLGEIEIGLTLADTPPRALFRSVFPDAPAEAYRLLDRLTLPAWRHEDVARVVVILNSPVKEILLDAPTVSLDLVERCEILLAGDELVWRARKAVSHTYELAQVATAVAVLRSHDLLHDVAQIPDGVGRRTFTRALRADLSRGRCPDNPFPVPPGWRRIETVADLWALGAELQICLRPGEYNSGDGALGLVEGRDIFLVHEALRGVAHFRARAGHWTMTQCAGARNADMPLAVVRELQRSLRQAGLPLLATDIGDSLDSLLRQRLRRGVLDDVEDNDDENDGEAGLAA